MKYFLFILTNNILPIFTVIGIGALINHWFHLDVKTLSKLNLYVMVPAFIFNQLYTTELSKQLLGNIIGFMIIFLIALYVASLGISKILGYDKNMRSVFANSVMFYNSGNFGIPLITLAFNQNPIAVSIQIIVLVMQNMTTFTLGAFQVADKGEGIKQTLLNIAKLPSIYAIILAALLRVLHIDLWQPIATSVGYLTQAMIGIALLTLGMQLASTRFEFQWNVLFSNAARLIGGPLIALGIMKVLGFHGLLAQVLLVSAGLPTAVNIVLLSLEYDSEPDFASRTVFSATLLSALTETGFIYLAQHFVI